MSVAPRVAFAARGKLPDRARIRARGSKIRSAKAPRIRQTRGRLGTPPGPHRVDHLFSDVAPTELVIIPPMRGPLHSTARFGSFARYRDVAVRGGL